MGNLIGPEYREFKGPFILDEKALLSLGQCLEKITEKVSDGYVAILETEAEKLVESKTGSNESISLKKARKMVANRSVMRKEENTVEIWASDGTRLKDRSIYNILKDPKIELFSPVELNVRIRKGTCDFRLEVLSNETEEDLSVEIRCQDDNINSEMWHLINSWLSSNKQSVVLQFLPKVTGFLKFIGFAALFLWLLSDFGWMDEKESSYDQYRKILKVRVDSIFEDGFQESELMQGVEILLEDAFKLVPNNFEPMATEHSFSISMGSVFIAITLVFIFTVPKSILGIGRKRWIALLYKYWKLIVLIWLPGSVILPILIDKLM